MPKINHSELLAIIQATSGAKPIGIEATTKANKKRTPLGDILKQIRAVTFVGASYESAVERQQSREGIKPDFDADKLPWGNWLVANKVIEHNGSLYLRTQTAPGQRLKQPAKVLGYFDANGNPLNKETVAPYLPIDEGSSKQEDAGLDKPSQVMVRNYKFDSLDKVRIAGKTYTVTH